MLGRREKGVPGSEVGRDIEVAGKKSFNKKVGIKTPGSRLPMQGSVTCPGEESTNE